MDEKAVVKACAAAIDANSATFLAGLVKNGVPCSMESAHKTVLGSIVDYYTCKINCPDKTGGFLPGISNLNHGTAPRVTTYQVEIYVADYATPEQNEPDSFVTSHENFRLFVDRIADYFLMSTEWITDADSGKSFRLPPENRTVRVQNLNPVESQEGYPVLGSVIRFQVYGCND